MKLIIPRTKRVRTGFSRELTVEIPAEYAGAYIYFISTLEDGMVRVEISKPTKPRTTGAKSQNAHLNGHIQQICIETGNDFEDVKMAVKRRAFRRGLPYKTNYNGDVVYSMIDGEPVPISEADMTTIECGYVIDEVHQLASELGIKLREE